MTEGPTQVALGDNLFAYDTDKAPITLMSVPIFPNFVSQDTSVAFLLERDVFLFYYYYS